ncbi:MAG: LCP family protein, partial [Clostridia bacterium]|nr:LCP family protein [Clostridia bacterium]
MNEQNKNKNTTVTHRKVNRKPSTAPAVIIAIVISLFVVLMAVLFTGGCALFSDYENPNKQHGDDYVDYYTDEDGNKYYTSVDDDGNNVIIDYNVKNQYNFLVIGKDRAAFNTDVIILVSYNITDGSVSMMQIPRDTYIQLPDSKGNVKGRKANALLAMYYNQAKATGKNYSDSVRTACGDLRDAMSEVFGIPINHFIMLDLEGFVNIVDAIGGVELNVPQDMKYNDPEQGLYINLKKGYQTLDGDKAEQFIRFRKGYVNADLGRVDAQKIFISAFIEKVQKSFSVETIVAIVRELSKYVVTDIDIGQMIYFAKSAISVDTDNISMLTLPGDLAGSYYVAYRDDTFDAINTNFNPFSVSLKKSIFDPNGSLFDAVGTRIYGVYTKTYSGYNDVPTYSAGEVGDIHIPQLP